MCFLVQRHRLLRRVAHPTVRPRGFPLFTALLCLYALAGSVAAQEPPKLEATGGKSANAADNPLTPHPPGIYYFVQQGSVDQLVELEAAPSAELPSSQSGMHRRGAGAAIGVGSRWKSMIFGTKSHIRLPAGRPVFYFYFPTSEANAARSETVFRSSSSPNEFILVHLASKKNDRQIPTVGDVAPAVQPKDVVPFDYEKTASGTYKVQLKSDLGSGEYAFLYAGVLDATNEAWFFDFGVDGAKKP